MKHLLLSLFVFAASVYATPLSYQVTVDTSAFIGQNARGNFQFNPGGFSPDAAFMQLNTLAGVGSTSVFFQTGDVTGTNPFTFGNTLVNNLLILDLLNLSSSFSFVVTFSGDAIDNPSSLDATSFFFAILNSTGTLPLAGFNQPSLSVDVSQGGIFVSSQDSLITFVDAVPEPGTLSLLALGLFGVIATKRRR
jgi:hypothetical protein